MKRVHYLSSLLIAAFICSGICIAADNQITVAGSSTIQPIIEQAAKEFKKTHPDVTFVIGGGGSSHGVKATAAGEVLLGTSSRDLNEKEMAEWKELIPTKIGMDGVAMIVNSGNPVSKITKQQIQDIYTGKITNWKQVGGNDMPIIVVSKEEGRSTLDLFLEYSGLEAKQSEDGKTMVHRMKGSTDFCQTNASVIGPNREAIAAVSTKPSAIAYVSVGTAQDVATKGGHVKLLDLDGVPASVANVTNHTYPLRRPLNVVTKGAPQGTVKEFVDFLMKSEGQQIVTSLDFIAVGNGE